jgi:parvulin-like peptidyl-prolyl isomerase
MRRQGASIFVYLIFCLLIVIFVINFRPGQSRTDDNGCRGTSNTVISVDGVDTTQTAFKVAYSANGASGKQKTYVALEVLIRRELLAQAAEARGLMADDDLVMNEIKKGHFFFGGQTATIPGIFDKDHFWNIRAFDAWYQQLNVSRNSYIEEQKRAMLAAMMADILKESVQVSREEALSQFLFENNTATYDLVAFRPDTYRSALEIGASDIDRYASTHADEISARFKADERLYKGTKPALLLREIFIAKPETGSGSAGSASPGMTIDQAKAKLEQVKKDVGGDKTKFAAAAKELSTDPTAKASGGALGWHTAENPTLGDKAVNDAVKTLKPGETTPVITTDKGAYLVLAEDKREGDLKLDQVKHEIAETLAKDTWAKEAAKRAAIAALDGATKNGMHVNLDDLYKPSEAPAGGGQQITPEMLEQLQKMMNDPNTSPEQKKQLEQLLMHGAPHGERESESKDIPAGWFEDDSGAVPAGSAVAAGSAGSAGSAATPAPAPAPAPAPDVVASNDVLPPLGAIEKPSLEHIGPTPRSTELPGLGASKAAATAVFDELKPGEYAKKVYEADGAFVVIQLRDRQQPNVADFDKTADDRIAQLRATRAQSFVETWLKTKCEALAKDKKIIPATDKITDRDDDGKLEQTGYRPCMSFH